MMMMMMMIGQKNNRRNKDNNGFSTENSGQYDSIQPTENSDPQEVLPYRA